MTNAPVCHLFRQLFSSWVPSSESGPRYAHCKFDTVLEYEVVLRKYRRFAEYNFQFIT